MPDSAGLKPQAHLQQQGNEIRHAASAHAREQVAEQADAEGMDFEELQREQRIEASRRVQAVCGHTGKAQDQQHQNCRALHAELGETIEGNRYRHHAERQQRVAHPVEARH